MAIDREARWQALHATDEAFLSAGQVVAGMDEVGRGPLAGDVVVACVVMPMRGSWDAPFERGAPSR